MRGYDARTGTMISGDAWRAAALRDVVLTPLGSRVMRRNYGTRVLELLAAPLNPATRLKLYASVVAAVLLWAPWYRLRRVQLVPGAVPGSAVLEFEEADPAAPRLRLALPASAPAASAAAA